MPAGFTSISQGRATAFARVADAAAISELLQNHQTLYDAALARPRFAELRGRGMAPVVDLAGDRCVVRHFRRGGSVMSVLGDRYVRAGRNRVLDELNASETMRARGVATPRIKCGAWYDDGMFRRYDIATHFIPSTRDLADVLFDDAERTLVVEHTAVLLRDVVHNGLLHHDLNLKNILIAEDGAYVLDLDRAQVFDRLTQVQASAMRTRFLRSLSKWEQKLGRTVPPSVRTSLGEAFVV